MRSFNTAGPVNATDHYLIAPLSRSLSDSGRKQPICWKIAADW